MNPTTGLFRLVRRRWWSADVLIAQDEFEVGGDDKWGYEIQGADGRACAISTRRYETLAELVDDLEADWPRCRVELL